MVDGTGEGQIQLLESRQLLSTLQDFNSVNQTAFSFGVNAAPYSLAQSLQAGGPTSIGKFIRLAPQLAPGDAAIQSSITFPVTDNFAAREIVVDFDFRMQPKGNGSRADGFGFALLNKANYPQAGAIIPPNPAGGPQYAAEEPNFDGSIGFGFDLFNNGVISEFPGDDDLNELDIHNVVSLHFDGPDGRLVEQFDATPFVDLGSGVWTHARIVISQPDPDADSLVTLSLSQGFDGKSAVIIDHQTVPGLRPYIARAWFGGRSGNDSANHDLDNIRIHFSTVPNVSVVSLHSARVQAVEGQTFVATVRRDGSTDGTTTVNFTTVNATATAGTDFTAATGTLTFLPGETEKAFPITIANNAAQQAIERQFLISLTAITGGVIGGATSVVTIVDDELARIRGHWSETIAMDVAPIHSTLLPTNELIFWDRIGNVRLLDLATGNVLIPGPDDQPPQNLFCSGHTLMTDGRLFVAGGHHHGGNNDDDGMGIAQASIYDPITRQWTAVPDMAGGRWYPTVLALPNGEVLVLSGSTVQTADGYIQNTLPQVYQPTTNTWRNLTNAEQQQIDAPENDKPQGVDLYPRLFVAPDGRVVKVGVDAQTWFLDTSGTGNWTKGPMANNAAPRTYGTAVMFRPGMILIMGGGDPPTATAEVLDLNQPNPTWQNNINPMNLARRQHNAVVLSDGRVLVTGGSSGPGFSNETAESVAMAAEVWDPTTGVWTLLPKEEVARLYHSGSLQRPDGRVMSLGGGQGAGATSFHADADLYSPSFLYAGSRPVISAVASNLPLGQEFVINTPDAADIQRVSLSRLASVTHSFDMNQLHAELMAQQVAGGIRVSLPTNINQVPPGVYLLSLVNSQGVPSNASFVQIDAVDQTAPTVMTVASDPAGTTTQRTVTFAVVFSEAVTHVSSDDFQLTTTGSAAGIISDVIGSGTSYTVTVSSITGEGNLRLDLKSAAGGSDVVDLGETPRRNFPWGTV